MLWILKRYFWQIFTFVLLIIIIVSSHIISPHKCVTKVTSEDLMNAQKLSHAINVSPKTAAEIQKEIIVHEKPVERYYVNNTETVVKHEEATKKEHKADRVIVTEKNDKAVDVYRITLTKNHKIKAGMTIEEGRAYPAVGYQAGRFEGIATLNGTHIKSATVMYTIKEW